MLLVVGYWFMGKYNLLGISNKSEKPKTNNFDNSNDQNTAPTADKKVISSEAKTIFVPYWADLSKELDVKDYDRVVYFGLNADYRGLLADESRMKNLHQFVVEMGHVRSLPKYLTVIMTNTDVNINVLKDKKSWGKIIDDSILIANENGFDGIVLDLEMSFIPLSNETMEQLNDFVKLFSQQTRNSGIKLAMTVYGDVFYRHRPYNVKSLAQSVDEVMIMAYDLHKSQGEPGPNFPLTASDGYDFQEMIEDFTSVVPAEKLTVIFGMYGYDWPVDEKKRPISAGKALTLDEIRQQFLSKCEWQDCVVKRDGLSKETEINYVKSEIKDDFATMYYHIVWFEDEQSSQSKIEYLKERGIGSVGYWVWGYF